MTCPLCLIERSINCLRAFYFWTIVRWDFLFKVATIILTAWKALSRNSLQVCIWDFRWTIDPNQSEDFMDCWKRSVRWAGGMNVSRTCPYINCDVGSSRLRKLLNKWSFCAMGVATSLWLFHNYPIAGWLRRSMSIHFTFLGSLSARRAHQAKARVVWKNLRRSAGRWLARFPKRAEKVKRKEFTAHQSSDTMASKRTEIACTSFIKHRSAARIRRKALRCLHRRQVITEIT